MKAFVAGCILGLCILGMFYVHISSLTDWSVGTNNSYCYIDFHRWTTGCEHAE